MNEETIIQKIKHQTKELWNTIQEAKKHNVEIDLSFNSTLGRTKPEIKISKMLFEDTNY